MTLRVSFITPTFNDQPEHLMAAVASVQRQTWPNVEHVVVDDGSTDPRAARMAEEAGVKVLWEENGGPSMARNTAVAATTGEILIFLDSDDWVSPTYAAESSTLLKDPSTTIAFPTVKQFGGNDVVDARTADRTIEEFFSSSGVPIASACRRADFNAAGGFDSSLRKGYEDQEFWIRLMLTRPGLARHMPTAVLNYRVREGSRSRLVTNELGNELTRRHAITNAQRQGHGEELAMSLWRAVDSEVSKRRRVTSDPLYLRPHVAAAKNVLTQLGRNIVSFARNGSLPRPR